LLLAYLLLPFVDFLQRRLRWKSRTLAVSIPFALILTLVSAFLLVTAPQLRKEARLLVAETTSAHFLKDVAAWSPLGIPVGRELLANHDLSRIVDFMPQISKTARAAARDLTNLVVIPILSFFLLRDGPWMRGCLLEILFGEPGNSISGHKRRILENILGDAHKLIVNYMRALLLLCAFTLLTFSVFLSLIHVPYAILLAFLAFALEFVPVFGPLVAALMILAVCQLSHYPKIAWIVIFLVLFRFIQDYLVSPHLMERSVKLHPLLVLFGIFAGGEIAGITGIFLSVPILALLRLAFYEWHKAADRRISAMEPSQPRDQDFALLLPSVSSKTVQASCAKPTT
jgi:predicted PurR-regulated permease PerM